MSGTLEWIGNGVAIASETDVGAYLPGTGIAEIPGGAATKGGGAGAWDMDWSWGSEVVPLQFAGFAVDVTDLTGGNYAVSLTPVPEPISMIFFGTGVVGVFGYISRKRLQKR